MFESLDVGDVEDTVASMTFNLFLKEVHSVRVIVVHFIRLNKRFRSKNMNTETLISYKNTCFLLIG